MPDPTTAAHARELAERAEALAAEIRAFHARLHAAADEPSRHAGFRCDTAAGWLTQTASDMRETANDLDRIVAAAAPGVCKIPWGVCPDHGSTLSSIGGKSRCRRAPCRRTWDYARDTLPCTEPARWKLADGLGTETTVCDGHAIDAGERLIGATLTRLPDTTAPS